MVAPRPGRHGSRSSSPVPGSAGSRGRSAAEVGRRGPPPIPVGVLLGPDPAPLPPPGTDSPTDAASPPTSQSSRRTIPPECRTRSPSCRSSVTTMVRERLRIRSGAERPDDRRIAVHGPRVAELHAGGHATAVRLAGIRVPVEHHRDRHVRRSPGPQSRQQPAEARLVAHAANAMEQVVAVDEHQLELGRQRVAGTGRCAGPPAPATAPTPPTRRAGVIDPSPPPIRIRVVLLLVDLDGVVYRGRAARARHPGRASAARRAGDRVIYVTNNSRWHRSEYRARLGGDGRAGHRGRRRLVRASHRAGDRRRGIRAQGS